MLKNQEPRTKKYILPHYCIFDELVKSIEPVILRELTVPYRRSGRSERSISNVFFGILIYYGTYSRLRFPDMLRNRDYKLRLFLVKNDNYGVFTAFYETIIFLLH